MDVYLCHTPLHILISLIVANQNNSQKDGSTFFIIEDSPGLHRIAEALIDTRKSNLVLLPGLANSTNRFQSAMIMRSNAIGIHRTARKFSGNFFIFNDIRPEAQFSLSRLKGEKTASRKSILLEDGIAIYNPGGTSEWNILQKIKYKIISGLNWIPISKIGSHPAISEIYCFYPQALRPDLMEKKAFQIPRCIPKEIIESFKHISPVLEKNTTIIALPLISEENHEAGLKFIERAMIFCKTRKTTPFFKTHPRDQQSIKIIENLSFEANTLPNHLPLELIILANEDIDSIIGSRTSALHISKFFFPKKDIYYIEEKEDTISIAWENFFRDTEINNINN